MPNRNNIGLAALEMDCKLNTVKVLAYRLILDNQPPDQEQIQLTRRGANQLSFVNGSVPITDLGVWKVVSLSRLNTPDSEWKGLRCQATDERQIVLRSDQNAEREAIRRLLNQALMQGARNLARAKGRLSADWGSGNRVELADQEPSERVKMRSAYLEALKTVTLIPEILPDGTALVSFNVRHRLLALPHITMDWVLRKKPEWLDGIRRVRHRYELPGKGRLSAEWVGVAAGETPMSTFQTAQGEFSYFDYHARNGNIPPGEEDLARKTQVVRIRYSKNKEPVLHLASLLQPMFDFETLQDIDSDLLQKLAGQLKWPVGDRLKTAHDLIRDIRIPYWNARLRRIGRIESHTLSLKPTVRLQFAHGKYANNEKEVVRLGAYRGMTRKRIVPMVAGDTSEAESAKRHFLNVKAICERWSGGESPAWPKSLGNKLAALPKSLIVKDAAELDARLCRAEREGRKVFSDTMFLIGLGEGADKRALRDVAFRHGIATQFMRLDYSPKRYTDYYYNNLAAGLFSKAGGIICAVDDMPGDTELFVGLDLGGTGQRVPGMAFLFTRKGVQLGWQLADTQRGERVSDDVLKVLLERSFSAFKQHEGRNPLRIALHRDGRFFESLNVLRDFEQKHGVGVNVLEVIKSGSPPLFRRLADAKGNVSYSNPEVGDAFLLTGLDEMIVSTYSGGELGTWGKSATVRPLRLRKRHGETDLLTLAQQVILLSRIHGASLYRHPRLPVTTHHADRFAALRQECNLDDLSKMDRWCPVYL